MSKHKKKTLARRNFAVALTAPPALLPQQVPQPPPAGVPNPNTSQPRRGPAPEVPPSEAPIQFTRQDVPGKIQPFPMTQVKLLPSIYTEVAEWNRGYMQRLPAGRLLYNFRENAGLPVGSTQPFGGWEQKANGQRGSELRGHFTGHFLSASAQLYASMGDQQAKAKADEIVSGLAKCQEKLGGGYLSAFPTSFWDRLDSMERGNVPWAPFYTLHKIMAGFFDMYNLAGNKEALKEGEGKSERAAKWSRSK